MRAITELYTPFIIYLVFFSFISSSFRLLHFEFHSMRAGAFAGAECEVLLARSWCWCVRARQRNSLIIIVVLMFHIRAIFLQIHDFSVW